MGTQGDDYFLTHSIGDSARSRYDGMLVPSARESGTSHLVLFENLESPRR
ncbi:MAG: RES family NAD+ phosphorylase [Cyanobium sp.]